MWAQKRLEVGAVTASTGFEIQGMPATNLAPGESTSFVVALSDTTQGMKQGEVQIANNDTDENPFVIQLTAEILNPDTRPREIVVNTAVGNLLKIDPLVGVPQMFLSNTTPLTDIAYNPRNDKLYGVDGTFLYEIKLASKQVVPLFAHNVRAASALGFSPSGDLFAAGEDVYLLDVANKTSKKYAEGGATLAGDIAFLGNRLLMSTTSGDLYEVQSNRATLLGNLAGVAMKGLVATDTNTLYGFSDNRGYLININNLTLTPQFGLLVFAVAGATFQPIASAHNPDNPLDVDADGFVVPLDALLIINELNTPTFTDPTTGRIIGVPQGQTRYPDVNDDGYVTPVDALLVINQLNSPTPVNAIAATDSLIALAGVAADDVFPSKTLLPTDLATDLARSLHAADLA